MGEPVDLGGGVVQWQDGTVGFVTLATDDHDAHLAEGHEAYDRVEREMQAEGAERALLKRNVAEVVYRLRELRATVVEAQGRAYGAFHLAQNHYENYCRGEPSALRNRFHFQEDAKIKSERARTLLLQLIDVEAWLARATTEAV